MAAEAMLLSQPAAPQSGEDLTIGIAQAGSEGDEQESRRKEINSVALEGCLLQPQLQPLWSVLPSVPTAPARGTLPLENPTLG